MTSGKVTLIPAGSDENITTIREFRTLLQSSIGPKGANKLLVTGGGYLEITSTSASLLSRLEIENPICRYIALASGALPDNGLYFGVMVSHLVEQQWSCDSIPKQNLLLTSALLIEKVREILSSELLCQKVDFSSINSFLPLVKTVVSSKVSRLCQDLDINRFCLEVVKVFLSCMNQKTNSIGRIYIRSECGSSYISSCDGLLYQITEDNDLKIIKNIGDGTVKVLVFTMKLEQTSEETSSEMILLLEKALSFDVSVVACQKTVSPEIKFYLMRRNMLLLERMGTDLTAELIQISHSFPVSQINSSLVLNVNKFIGSLSSVKHVTYNENDYILLQNEEVSVGTLIIQSRSLAGEGSLKVLAQQAVDALRSLAAHPYLAPGGGCLEVLLIGQLSMLQECRRTDKAYLIISQWIQKALLSTCGSTTPAMIDSVYHHGWARKEETSCRCAQVTKQQLEEEGGQMIPLCEVLSVWSGLRLNPPKKPNRSLWADLLVDSHRQKRDVILSALETFVNLSDIGLIIHNES